MYQKHELLEFNWFDFLDWCSDYRNNAGMGDQFQFYTVPDSSGTSRKVPVVSEDNFWYWFLEYRFDKTNKERKDAIAKLELRYENIKAKQENTIWKRFLRWLHE